MKILYVYGDGDFAACSFEGWGGVERLKNEYPDVIARGADFTLDLGEDDGGEVYLEFKEFKDVDPDFIAFIRSEIQDYDASKCSNFYEL